jgi:hypothetical protein
LCVALVGCGRFTRPGATAADLERDRELCSRADPRLTAEYDRLTAERARWFSVMPSSRFNSPAYLTAEANHAAVSRERDRLSYPREQAFQRCMRSRGWTWTTS